MRDPAADSPRLPDDLADALGEALFRLRSKEERNHALAQLCAAHPQHAAALARAAAALDQTPTASSDLPERIGPYRPVARLGRGGFGEVYLAEQHEPVRRRVALKVVKRGMDSDAILLRFAREQQALARMSHEAIAKFYDAGATDLGQPYFAMELVEGKPITAFCDAKRMSLRERLRLFCQVCQGVQHAHQKGVLHRDLKPANVLVADGASGPVPKLIDFGIARALEFGDEDLTLTQSGDVLGTPLYMAPEQLTGDASRVDTRTDVHALGLLLFELLACAQPLLEMGERSRDPLAVREHLRLTDPARPSQRIAPGSLAMSWQRELRGDLDWIVQKACAREPERRYASAAELAMDIERHLAFEPVTAGPPTTLYLVSKFVRRNRGEVLTATLVVLTAVIGGVVSLDYARVANERANENEQLLIAAESARNDAQKSSEERAKKVREFDQLKGVVLLGEAKAAAASLYPAWPTRIDALRQWLVDYAEPLAQVRAAAESTLVELESLVEPYSDEDRQRDAAADPNHAQWQKARAAVESLRRARDVREGRLRVEVPPLPTEDEGASAEQLHAKAEARIAVDPALRRVHGEDTLGLRYAMAAREKASGTRRESALQIALAGALFGNGLDAEAEKALAAVPVAADPQDRLLDERYVTILQRTMPRWREELARWETELERLAPIARVRATFRFPRNAQAEAFLHGTLRQFVRDVDAFDREVVADVRRRIVWASFLATRESDPAFVARYESARAAVRTAPAYAGCDVEFGLRDLADLEPLGLDAKSGLFRFYHLPSAWDGVADPRTIVLPRIGADGRIEVTEETGMVFVLLPGGDVTLGCQNEDPAAPYYDPRRRPDEVLHTVRLAPFLIAAHEITQAQWERMWTLDDAGERPSRYAAGMADYKAGIIQRTHPVETVDLPRAVAMLGALSLQIPTEAQWEYACRGGTHSVRPFDDAAFLQHENVADATWRRSGSQGEVAEWDDGHVVHAPVGSYLPNAFGLHDMLGNVGEWAIDRYGEYGSEVDGDGLRAHWEEEDRILRGASFLSSPENTRCAIRQHAAMEFRNGGLGARVSRRLRVEGIAR